MRFSPWWSPRAPRSSTLAWLGVARTINSCFGPWLRLYKRDLRAAEMLDCFKLQLYSGTRAWYGSGWAEDETCHPAVAFLLRACTVFLHARSFGRHSGCYCMAD